MKVMVPMHMVLIVATRVQWFGFI